MKEKLPNCEPLVPGSGIQRSSSPHSAPSSALLPGKTGAQTTRIYRYFQDAAPMATLILRNETATAGGSDFRHVHQKRTLKDYKRIFASQDFL